MRKLAAIALAVLAIGACAKNEITLVPDPTLAGHYALRTVGGDSLPYTVISQPGLVVTITADTISLEVSGSFTVEYALLAQQRRRDGHPGGARLGNMVGGGQRRADGRFDR